MLHYFNYIFMGIEVPVLEDIRVEKETVHNGRLYCYWGLLMLSIDYIGKNNNPAKYTL